MSNPFIIFVGEARDNMQPHKSAPDICSAILDGKSLVDSYPCVEVTYMPEDNLDANEIIYSHYAAS